MSVSEIFVRRPVMTTLVMIGILVFGIGAYRLLPVSDLPNVDFPTIQVTATLPGGSPETMASAVHAPRSNVFTIRPSCMTMTRSARPMISGSSEEISITATPSSASSPMKSCTAAFEPTSMP